MLPLVVVVLLSPASVRNVDEKKQRRPRTSVTMMMVMMVMIIITQKFLVYKNFEDELQAN